MVPLFPYFYFYQQNGKFLALIIFVLASLTDILDGVIARKYKIVTKVGIVLDPLADKLMLLSALITLTIDNMVPFIVLLIVLSKELLMIGSGIFLFVKKEKTVIPANKFGKIATVIFFFAIAYVILGSNQTLAYSLLYFALSLKIIALVSYINHYFKRVRLKDDSNKIN
jgi:cardiolipin synthase